MGEPVNREDFRELREELKEGFLGVHGRLDMLNGRVGKGEVMVGTHDVRLTNLEREIFRRRRSDHHDGGDEGRRRIVGRVVTDRDVRIVWLTLAVVFGIVETIRTLWPELMHLVKP